MLLSPQSLCGYPCFEREEAGSPQVFFLAYAAEFFAAGKGARRILRTPGEVDPPVFRLQFSGKNEPEMGIFFQLFFSRLFRLKTGPGEQIPMRIEDLSRFGQTLRGGKRA